MCVLSLAVAALGIALANPEIAGLYHDDGIYALTGKAIAQGDGYRLINLPSAPPATKYPPLYPALLSLVWLASPEFPANLPLLKAVNAVLLALLLPVVYAWTGQLGRLSATERLFVCALVGTSPGLFWFSDILLSEPLFILLTACLFVVVEAKGEWTTRRAVLAGVIAGLAVLTRVPGLALAIAAAVFLLVVRPRLLLPFLGGLLVLALPWWIWLEYAAAEVGLLESYYVTYEPSAWTRIATGRSFTLHVVRFNALFFIKAASMAFGLPGGLLVTFGISLAALGAWRLRHAPSALFGALWAGTTTLALLGHPYPMARYLTPFVFVIYVLVIAGASSRGAWSPPRLTVDRRSPHVLTLLVAILLLTVNVVWLRHYRKVVVSAVHGEFGRAMVFQWEGFRQTIAWVRDNTSQDSRLASGHDTFYALNTGRRAVRPWVHRSEGYIFIESRVKPLPDSQAVLRDLDRLGVCYLVVDPLLGGGEGHWGRLSIRSLLTNNAASWRIIFASPASGNQVWIRRTSACDRPMSLSAGALLRQQPVF